MPLHVCIKSPGCIADHPYIIACVQTSQVVKMSLLNRHYKLVASRRLVSFGYSELLIHFCLYCVVDLRVGNHLDNLQLVRHTFRHTS